MESATLPRTDATLPDVTLLIVDDEPLVVDFFRQAMSKRGFHVLGCTGGEEAIALVQSPSSAIRLVVSDMSMPGMDGVALANRLYAINPTLPVLIATGHDTTPAQIGAPANVRDIIRKPYQARVLAERIREILGA